MVIIEKNVFRLHKIHYLYNTYIINIMILTNDNIRYFNIGVILRNIYVFKKKKIYKVRLVSIVIIKISIGGIEILKLISSFLTKGSILVSKI